MSVTQVVDGQGGRLEVGGVALDIPAGALRAPVQITMTVPHGEFLQVHFEPHGLTFESPVELEFDVRRSELSLKPQLLRNLVGVYFNGAATGEGVVQKEETKPLRVRGGRAGFRIDHFSGYCVAVG